MQVAAGMSVKFDVSITAPEVTEIGHVSLDVVIIMETEVFKLPILATVLPLEVIISSLTISLEGSLIIRYLFFLGNLSRSLFIDPKF